LIFGGDEKLAGLSDYALARLGGPANPTYPTYRNAERA